MGIKCLRNVLMNFLTVKGKIIVILPTVLLGLSTHSDSLPLCDEAIEIWRHEAT